MTSKNSLVGASAVYAILGLILLFFPNHTSALFCSVVGFLLLGYGAITVVAFFLRQGAASFAFQSELVIGVASAIVGVFFLTHTGFILSVIPTILGVYILIDALMNLKRGLDLRELGYAGWTTTLIMSVVSLVLGLVILWNPFRTGLILWRVIGGVFLYLGVSDLWAVLKLDQMLKK